MIYVFAVITIALLLWALRDEFRAGGSLHVELVGDDPTDGLIYLPRGDGWSDDDVLRTYAEIQAL